MSGNFSFFQGKWDVLANLGKAAERNVYHAPQREGIAIAKAEGKYKERKEVVILDFEKHYERYMNHES